jgi:hypothetical protein
MDNQPRTFRYVERGTLPGTDLLSLYDKSINLLIIDKGHFACLSDADREAVLRTEHSALLIEYPANRPPRIKIDDGS